MDGRGVTKGHIAVPHPGGNLELLEGGEPSEYASCEQVPYNCSLADIVTDHQPSRTTLANIIHIYESDIVLVIFEASFERQSIMVETYNHRALSIKK